MKLLMFYMPCFEYTTHRKSVPDAPDADASEEIKNCVVVLVQAEEEDPAKGKKVLDKLLKNTKWLAGKFKTRSIVLHFFSHLSESRSDPEYARNIMSDAAQRLENAGYQCHVTPFGYFCELKMHVDGESLAKVFKSF
jgi:hypothetical protein